MLDSEWSDFTGPGRSRSRDGRERMPAFLASHSAFFVLLGVLLGQVLLLSFQITRNRNVRLIHVWAAGVFGPFDRALRSASSDVGGAWSDYSGMWSAEEENHELSAQLAQARWRIAQLTEQAAEAARLRALLNFKTQDPLNTLAAEVIASSPAPGSRSVLIDRGQSDGLRRNMAVVTPSGIVGEIAAVYPHSAEVLLITDPSSGAGCMLAGSRTQGVLQGTGLAFCRLKYVMNDEPVKVGEAVLTSGLDQIYPKGLPVGVVASATRGNIYKDIQVKPAAALDRLENVLVVIGSSASAGPAPGERATQR